MKDYLDNKPPQVKNALGIFFTAQNYQGGLQAFMTEHSLWVGQFMSCSPLEFDHKVFTSPKQQDEAMKESDLALRDGGVEDSEEWTEERCEQAQELYARQRALVDICNQSDVLIHYTWAAQKKAAYEAWERVRLTLPLNQAAASGSADAEAAVSGSADAAAPPQKSLQELMAILGEEEKGALPGPVAEDSDEEEETAGTDTKDGEIQTLYVVEETPGEDFEEKVTAFCTAYMQAGTRPNPYTNQINIRMNFKGLLDSYVKVYSDLECTKPAPLAKLGSRMSI